MVFHLPIALNILTVRLVTVSAVGTGCVKFRQCFHQFACGGELGDFLEAGLGIPGKLHGGADVLFLKEGIDLGKFFLQFLRFRCGRFPSLNLQIQGQTADCLTDGLHPFLKFLKFGFFLSRTGNAQQKQAGSQR
ncbi:MAG: hypothetical protein O7E51_02270 [Acidobacteria bacterium]|nr:hypothetical protein [Acidobacteriota bacterium]